VIYNEEEFIKDKEFKAAFKQNRISAMSLALLTKKDQIMPEDDLYTQILNLTKY
jgi:hypothetical protein